MWKLTKTITILAITLAIVTACTKQQDSGDEQAKKTTIKTGDIKEDYKEMTVNDFVLKLSSTSVKDDTLTLHLDVENQFEDERLFDALVLNIQNADGDNLAVAADNNLGQALKSGEKTEGVVSFNAIGDGPYEVIYDDLEGTEQKLWEINR
ncbi:hypothetical protein GCM10007425_05990 [Lysinibacillus alkalisoli]|uniref:DUF4352 domain-containing protein n=1 Tax=Lysinibacillus alkalisoli TaxID=1911548 RepID=A0A917FYR8_9BACI|nr:DUF4352 domain-containing protein [Lysinibacillus alkalisoli]GGG14505.1 hypothetical protein GCM10007425_05990 [Lysinibacillus alkalisoli]